MMLKEKTNGWERMKWFVSVPVVMGAMLVFAQPKVNDKLEEMLPKTEQQSGEFENMEKLKAFFEEKKKAYEDFSCKEVNGRKVQVIREKQVHLFRVNKRNQVLVGEIEEKEIYLDLPQMHTLRPRLAQYLRDMRSEQANNDPQAIIFLYDAGANPDSLFSYLKQVKLAFDDIRQDYPQDENLDKVCPYWVVCYEAGEFAASIRRLIKDIEVSLYTPSGTLVQTFTDFTEWGLRDFLDNQPEGTIGYADVKPKAKVRSSVIERIMNVLRKGGVLKVNKK